MKNILLINGGGGSEHDISLRSSKFIENQIDSSLFKVFTVEMSKNFKWLYQGQSCEINFNKELVTSTGSFKIDAAIPCIHGYPGETGDIQAFFDLIRLPYIGCNSESSTLCFNKLLTKLVLEDAGILTAPFLNVVSLAEIDKVVAFLEEHKTIYIKATNQGSSVGCYKASSIKEVQEYLPKAFSYSPFVIAEKGITARELEVAVFEFNGKVHITIPGEISCPSNFYTFEEKYSKTSGTKTFVEAPNLSEEVIKKIKEQANKAFKILRLRHLSRIDFFLTADNEVYINEINTFPGHTEISMFPTMMENYGVKYSDFISYNLNHITQ